MEPTPPTPEDASLPEASPAAASAPSEATSTPRVAPGATRRPGARDFWLRVALGLGFWAAVSWATWREMNYRASMHDAKTAFAKRDWAGALRHSQAALAQRPASTRGAGLVARSLSRMRR